MFPKVNRLSSDSDFKRVFKSGRTLENQFFRIKFSKNQKGVNRFGFVVNNKMSKKAVVRNNIKRRLRSICRPLTGSKDNSFDMVVWPKTSSIRLKYIDFSNNLQDLIDKS